ncbi:MAG: PEP-CTERM sorting domain-containing protein [Planctomycetota bacterium]
MSDMKAVARWALVPQWALVLCMAGVLGQHSEAQITNIVGGTLLNGDFNDESLGTGPGGAFEQTFAQTLSWENTGTGGQVARATRNNNPRVDGTRNALVDDGLARIFGLDTGYSILDGDVFNLSYQWRDANNWNDALDEIAVTLFTTSDDTIGGAKSVLAESRSGLSTVNAAFELFEASAVYTATPADAGKNLFVELNGFNGGSAGDPEGVSRVDNFVLSVGEPALPPGPQPPSPLTGLNLFSDTFDRPDTTGLDLDSSLVGVSSAVFTPAAGQAYNEFDGAGGSGVQSRILSNTMELAVGAGQSYAGINRNFVDAEIVAGGGFAIEAIVDPKTGSNGDATSRYAAIGVGLDLADSSMSSGLNDGALAPDPMAENDDAQIIEQAALAFVIYDDGKYSFFDSFAETDGVGQPNPAPGDSNSDIFGDAEYESESVDGRQDFLSQVGQVIDDQYKVRLEYEVVGFEEGATVVLSAYIQDVKVDLDTSDGIEANPEDRDGYTFTWDGDDQNYIAFEGRAQTATTFDSLMIETLALPGDYNGDGSVDAADYTVWRDGLSPLDSIEGYNVWRSNFGLSVAAASAGAVPEPSSMLLLGCLAGASIARCPNRRAR